MNLLIAPYKLNSKPWPHHPGCNKRAETLRHFNNILIPALLWFIIKQACVQEDIFLNAFISLLHASRSHGLISLQIEAWAVLQRRRQASELTWERKKQQKKKQPGTEQISECHSQTREEAIRSLCIWIWEKTGWKHNTTFLGWHINFWPLSYHEVVLCWSLVTFLFCYK